ncbi:recombination regulator RecX [Streptomyces sp. NPDC088747]|uniref:recombination regulator RecX n=1 Tax=Streptomyces sp. NPDC088747 TaxID=3365886 RepID=UPI0038055160
MTRRTDWAEYTYPAAPEGQGQAYDGGVGGSAGDGDRAYGGGTGTDGFHGGDPDSGGSSPESGSRGGAESPWGAGPPGGGSRRGGGRRGDGGPRGRGRRRRGGFGEPSGDPQDGGAPSSSRAEKGEPPADPVERARAICLRLLTGTPRTRKQLADALHKREIPDDVAEQVLSRFEEVGLINDSAFADAWVESRHHGRGLARRALVQELRTKGVDSALIDEAVGQLDSEQEETTARELVARKLRSTRGLDRDKRLRRLAGMLARKGYPQGMALRVVRQALEEEGEDTEGLEDEGF